MDECTSDVCGDKYDCLNTVGSYECNCIVGTYQHYPVELASIDELFTYSPDSSKSVSSPVDVPNTATKSDIRFTLEQFHHYRSKGIHIPLEYVDRPKTTRKYKKMGYSKAARGADATVSKWTLNWDATTEKYFVPWLFDSEYPEDLKSPVQSALQEFEKSSCIKFVEISDEDANNWTSSILVHKGEDGPNEAEGCWSYVGRIGTSVRQYLSLSEGCHAPETVQHEFYHALGFWHEQQRADVLNYVDLHGEKYTCHDGSWTSNYQCLNVCQNGFRQWYDLKSPYDYDSIMHYNGNQCGSGFMTYKNTNTPVYPLTNGRFSTQDALQLNAFYQCDLQKTLPCDTWSSAHRASYLAGTYIIISRIDRILL